VGISLALSIAFDTVPDGHCPRASCDCCSISSTTRSNLERKTVVNMSTSRMFYMLGLVEPSNGFQSHVLGSDPSFILTQIGKPLHHAQTCNFDATEEVLCTYLFIRLTTLISLGHGTEEQSLLSPRNSTREDAEIAHWMLLHSASGGNIIVQPMELEASHTMP
jgi:hypothetical protein